jgi:hypothetical protein
LNGGAAQKDTHCKNQKSSRLVFLIGPEKVKFEQMQLPVLGIVQAPCSAHEILSSMPCTPVKVTRATILRYEPFLSSYQQSPFCSFMTSAMLS